MVRHAIRARPLALLSCLSLAACGQSSAAGATPTPASIPVVTPPGSIAPAPAPAASAAGGPRFTNDNWSAVEAAPGANRGAPVSITGRVFNLEQDQSREAVQLWTDPARQTGNTVVVFPKSGAPPLKKDDMVKVVGELDGEFVGKTDSGEVLHLPRVQATSITLLGPNGAAPTPTATGVVAGATVIKTLPPSPSPVRPLPPGIYRVTGTEPTGLNIRVGPALNQPKLGVLHDGALVQVISSPPGSNYVQVSGSGFNGYAARAYLTGPLQVGKPALGKLSPK
jgi:hypothetical protein